MPFFFTRVRAYYKIYGLLKTTEKIAATLLSTSDPSAQASAKKDFAGNLKGSSLSHSYAERFRLRISCGCPNILLLERDKVVRLWRADTDNTGTLKERAALAVAEIRAGMVDLVVMSRLGSTPEISDLVAVAHALEIPTAYHLEYAQEILQSYVNLDSESDPHSHMAADAEKFGKYQLARMCTFLFCRSESEKSRLVTHYGSVHIVSDWRSPQYEVTSTVVALLVGYATKSRPSVSMVSVLHGKAGQLPITLNSWFEQDYDGEVEILFVDDESPDDSASIAINRFSARRRTRPGGWVPEIRILRNERYQGNCISHNRGIKAAKGDIVIVIDADCMVNRSFVRHHVAAHVFGDCDIVIGPMGLQTSGDTPQRALERYENDPALVLSHTNLQDPINRQSFLNCTTGNLSIGRGSICEDLFDPVFSRPAGSNSGPGWEDIEMGYRLYQKGARIKFVEEAFSVRVVVPPGLREDVKPIQTMKDFRRLFEKHPELGQVAHRWAYSTLENICTSEDKSGLAHSVDCTWLLDRIGPMPASSPAIRVSRRYRVLTYRWHVPHQYELYKLPCDFTLVTGLGCPMTESWDYSQRPMPRNAKFVPVDQVDPREYDFAILHFDENVLSPQNTNGVLGEEWGRSFKWFRENVNLPMIAICHGTPQFYGQYNIAYSGPDLMQPIEEARLQLISYVGDIPVVCNSHQAAREWQFRNSRVIWHGFDPTEFPPATYKHGIISPLGPLVLSRPHYRGYFLYRKVFDGHYDELKPQTLKVPDPDPRYAGNAYAQAKYRNYLDEIRKYSVYFNPTLRSPMPRARAEPMMCGVVTVSAQNHDVDMFIQNGKNGFYSADADELREQLRYLIHNPDQARKIGMAGRSLACIIFNYDRYLSDWCNLIEELVGTSAQSH